MEITDQKVYYTKHDHVDVEGDFYFHLFDLTAEDRSILEKELNYWRERLIQNEKRILFFFTIQFNFSRTKAYGFNSLEMAHKATRDWSRSFMHKFTRMPNYFFRFVYPNSKKLHVHGLLIGNGNTKAIRGDEWKNKEAKDCIQLIHDSFRLAKIKHGTFAKATLDIEVYDKNDNAINYIIRKQNRDIDPRKIKRDYELSWVHGHTGMFTYTTDFWPKKWDSNQEDLYDTAF